MEKFLGLSKDEERNEEVKLDTSREGNPDVHDRIDKLEKIAKSLVRVMEVCKRKLGMSDEDLDVEVEKIMEERRRNK